MRLLHTTTRELVEFVDVRHAPDYAILSHTWDAEEVLFTDIIHASKTLQSKKGYRKLDYLCKQARLNGYAYAWMDTCCIDKSSSAELSEAINSMYQWYEASAVCYVYLQDYVHVSGPVHGFSKLSLAQFQAHRWFTRGWTLQELIAPECIEFYDTSWRAISTLSDIVELVSNCTGIDVSVLTHDQVPYDLTVAKRMSWAAHRTTTRLEDMAYSLLGLFDVNMPLLYGEGHRAFLRLQEEILRTNTDLSILAWNRHDCGDFLERIASLPTQFLAPSPICFYLCGDIISVMSDTISESWLTNSALHTTMRICDVGGDTYLAVLNCGRLCGSRRVIALNLRIVTDHSHGTGETTYVVSNAPHGRIDYVDDAAWRLGQTQAIRILRGTTVRKQGRLPRRMPLPTNTLYFTKTDPASTTTQLVAKFGGLHVSSTPSFSPGPAWRTETLVYFPKATGRQIGHCGILIALAEEPGASVAITFAYSWQTISVAIHERVKTARDLEEACGAIPESSFTKARTEAIARRIVGCSNVVVIVNTTWCRGEIAFVALLETQRLRSSVVDGMWQKPTGSPSPLTKHGALSLDRFDRTC